MENVSIDYSSCPFTGKLGFIITYESDFSINYYKSPLIFNNLDDAYYSACLEISGK